jgi:hypothetical protein
MPIRTGTVLFRRSFLANVKRFHAVQQRARKEDAGAEYRCGYQTFSEMPALNFAVDSHE